MGHLTPTFGEEFRLATDDEILAVDFWSYLNARQARLPLTAGSQPLWNCLEELERDLEPLLDERTPLSHREFLASASRKWTTEPDAATLRTQVRHEVGAMLGEALTATELTAAGATGTPRRNHAQPS